MKAITFFIFIFIIIFSSCGKQKTKNIINPIDIKVDTTKYSSSTKLTKIERDKSNKKLPDWLYQKNIEIKKDLRPNQNSNIEQFEKLNDYLYTCVYSLNDGTCGEYLLVTYINEKEIDNLEVGIACDHEQSLPNYKWKEFKTINSHLIKTIEFTEFVHDSIVNSDGWIKEKYADTYDRMLDSVVNFYKINVDGRITNTYK